MAYLNKLQYKLYSTITIEHAGFNKKKNEKPKFCCCLFLLRQCNCTDSNLETVSPETNKMQRYILFPTVLGRNISK